MRLAVFVSLTITACLVRGQSSPQQTGRALAQPIQSADLVEFQIRKYVSQRVSRPKAPGTAEQWTAESKRIRTHLLDDIIFHGWPKEWVSAPLKSEDAGVTDTGKGYRMRKLRYEIVPGFWTSAIAYEPASFSGKIPAVLKLNGHG